MNKLSNFNSSRHIGIASIKFGTARQATDDNTRITERTRFAFWITRATDTQSERRILIAFLR